MRESKADKLKILELAKKHDLTPTQVREIVKSQFDFVRSTNKKLEIPDGLTREEFVKLRTNYTFLALGKLYASYFLYQRIQENKNKSKN